MGCSAYGWTSAGQSSAQCKQHDSSAQFNMMRHFFSVFNNQWIGAGYHSNCSDARAKHDMHICGYYINILMHEQIVFVLISTSEGCSATVWGSKTQIKLYSSSHKHSRKCGTTGSIEKVRTGYQSKRGLNGFNADARTAPGHQNDSSSFFIGL